MSSPQVCLGAAATSADRRVVFHADDLGLNSAIDDGIFDAFTRGVLTSTAILANGPTAETAIARVRSLAANACLEEFADSPRRKLLDDPRSPIDIGVHLNLTQGRPLTAHRYPSVLLDDQGRFPGPGRLFAALLRSRRQWSTALKAELAEQIAWVVDHGVRPTHVNGHQYVELFPGVGQIVTDLLPRFSIRIVRLPIEQRLWSTTFAERRAAAWTLAHVKRRFAMRFARHLESANLEYTDGFFGTAHAGHMTMAALSRRLRTPIKERLLEIGVHPGRAPDHATASRSIEGWHDPLAAHRPAERELLCSDALTDLLADRNLRLGRLSTLAANKS